MIDPRPYQTTGADFLARNANALLGDDAGLGKSRTAIMAADRLDLKRRLIICPAVARLVWPQQISLWSAYPTAPVHVVDPVSIKHQPQIEALLTLPRITIVIAFDSVSNDRNHPRLLTALRQASWDVVIVDEGQKLASPGSNRTTRIYGPRLDRHRGLIEHAERVWVLSGTPTPNHAGEIYTHARALFPQAIMLTHNGIKRPLEEHEFQERYCRYKDTSWGRVVTGSQNLPELRARLGPWIMRRRKKDVLPELPPLDYVSVPVPVSTPAPDPQPTPPAAQIPAGLEGDELVAFLAGRAPALATVRRELGMHKAPACVEYIREMLDTGVQKAVVFAHHRELIAQVVGDLSDYNPVTITGDTSEPQRKRAITAFQNNPDTRVLVGQIDACGVAITLTAARDVVFIECSWVPGANHQAASRCHRLGQNNAVLARFLYVPGSLDERIMRTFQRKASELAQLWD